MGFIHHSFSDVYAHKDNWLTGIDARVKIFYLVTMLTINLFAKNIYISSFFLLFSLTLLLTVKIPFLTILKNIFLPLSLAFLILVVKGLHEGENEMFGFSVLGYDLIFKEEGLRNGLLICAKVLGGVSLVILVAFTTTISRLSAALQWIRVPNTFIELLTFIYRYIFLLLDEVSTMRNAQKSRLGYTSFIKTIKSYGALGGALIVRAFERAERTHEAMHVRGYDGESTITYYLTPLRKKEYLLFTGIALTAPLHLYAGSILLW